MVDVMEWDVPEHGSDTSMSLSTPDQCQNGTTTRHKNWHSVTSSDEFMDQSSPPNKKIRLEGGGIEYQSMTNYSLYTHHLADQGMHDASQQYMSSSSNALPYWCPSDSEWCDTTPSSSLPFDEEPGFGVNPSNSIAPSHVSVCSDGERNGDLTVKGDISLYQPGIDQDTSLVSVESSIQDKSPSSRNIIEVCYGALINVNTQILQDPGKAKVEAKDDHVYFDVVAPSKYYVLRSAGENIASLNERVSGAFLQMKDRSVRYKAFISSESWISKIGKWKKSSRAKTSDQIPASINIYGPETLADNVGDMLSDSGLYLQHPIHDHSADGIPYKNPQWLEFSAEDSLEESGTEAAHPDSETPSSIEYGYEAMFDPENQHRFLEEAIIDTRVVTCLLSHQRQAVDFIRKKETGSLDNSLNLWQLHRSENGLEYYHHVLTQAKTNKIPFEPKGGILADDMGLGKSLTMLASIVGTLELAQSFSVTNIACRSENGTGEPRVPTTLIVGPSALILDSWEEEISRHISAGVLKVHRYHGFGKEIDPEKLQEYDIVLTTYATIESDDRRRTGFFQSICWYRIILDEAHVIRTRSTKQFQAAFKLAAHVRWCLTGTPIQNRLEDFGSLVGFLKVHAIENLETFRKLIVEVADPKKRSTPDFSNLKKLLSSMCLRRSRHLLSIPEPEIRDIGLQLSPFEQNAYDAAERSWKSRLEDARKKGNHGEFKKGFLRKYQSLRMICNHGVHESSKVIAFTESPAESDLETRLSTCEFCFIDVSTFPTEKGATAGLHPSCSPEVCLQCLPKFTGNIPGSLPSAETVLCVVCDKAVDLLPSQSPVVEGTLPYLDTLLTHVPTKLAAVVDDIEESVASNKSLVFSAWKRSLDMLGMLLNHRGIQAYCIHGQLSVPERRRILLDFRENKDARVLLMTFGTGGVGLNLLSVDRIHILEPQWNPAVENQAIGRAIRLGQTKSVTILRYVIDNSIEATHVRLLQEHKLKLAAGFENQPAKNHMDRELELLMYGDANSGKS